MHRRIGEHGLLQIVLLHQRMLHGGHRCSTARAPLRVLSTTQALGASVGMRVPAEAGQRCLLLVGQLRVGQLAALLGRYLLAVAQLMDVQRTLQIEAPIAELALAAGRQGGVTIPWTTTAAETHLEVIIVRPPVGAQQRSDVELGATHSARIGRLGFCRRIAAQVLVQVQTPELILGTVTILLEQVLLQATHLRGSGSGALGSHIGCQLRLGHRVTWR